MVRPTAAPLPDWPSVAAGAIPRGNHRVLVRPALDVALWVRGPAHAQLTPVHQRQVRAWINPAHASQHAATTYRETSAQTRTSRPPAHVSTTPGADLRIRMDLAPDSASDADLFPAMGSSEVGGPYNPFSYEPQRDRTNARASSVSVG